MTSSFQLVDHHVAWAGNASQTPVWEHHYTPAEEGRGVGGGQVGEEMDGGGGEGDSFFATYFAVPRFAAETTLGALSVLSNALSLSAFNYVYGRQTAYHILFLNLAIGNILSTLLSWLCNNVLFLFSDQMRALMQSHSLCEMFVYLMAAAFASTACGLVSSLTMLGFSTVQYFAVCRPLDHTSIVRKRRICVFLLCAWLVSLSCACVPFFVMLGLTHGGPCGEPLLSTILLVVVIGTDISLGVVILTYLSIVALCLRIYSEIQKLRKRLSQFRFEHEVSGERKAFVTIIILLSTLTVFFIPYVAVYAITLNSNNGVDMHSDALIYYMNLLPYLKFFTDPIIYGMRMREVREGWSRMMITCGMKNCSCVKHEFSFVPQTTTSTVSVAQVVSTSV